MKDVEKATNSPAYAKLLVHNQLGKGAITRLAKGVYSFHSDPALAVFAFKPAYLGLEFALSLYELWEQEAVPVIVTSRKVRIGVRQVAGENVLVRRVGPRMMFGYSVQEYFGFHLPVSEPEKTLVDFLHFREPIPAAALGRLLDACGKQKLRGCLSKAGFVRVAKQGRLEEALAKAMRVTGV